MKKFLLLTTALLSFSHVSYAMDLTMGGSQDEDRLSSAVSLKAPFTIVDSSLDCTGIQTALTTALPSFPPSIIATITDCFDDTIIITRENNKKGLAIRVLTPRLSLNSLTLADMPTLESLFGDPAVMEKFAERAPRKKEAVQARVQNILLPRWQNGDQGGGFVVRSGKTPIGFIVCAGTPKQAELAFLLFNEIKGEQIWGKGYGREAVTAYVTRFIPRMIREGLLALREIVATSSFDNPGSTGILDRLGFKAAHPDLPILEDDSVVKVGVRYNIKDKKGTLRTAEKIKYTVKKEEEKDQEKIITKIHLSRPVER